MFHGERVTLRPMLESDLPTYLEYRNDIDLHFLSSDDPPTPITIENLKAKFDSHDSTKAPWFAIEFQGRFIGQCIVYDINYFHRNCAIGLTIGDKDCRGIGLGSEVVNLLCMYAFDLLNMEKVWLQTTGNNKAAIQCYKKCGFVVEGVQKNHVWYAGKYEELITMGRFKHLFGDN